MIFVPGTPRALTVEAARTLADLARAQGLKMVGVFRDASVAEVVSTATDLKLDAVQLHGDENAAEVREALGEGVDVWAVCADGAPSRAGADRSLFDHGSGGTGIGFDWSLLKGRDDLASGFLAGGIGPANAASAARVGAYGLDVGSGVEAAPGKKDAGKVKALFDALRPVSRGDLA